MNIKVFNLLTCYVSWHETCACKCRLDVSVCSNDGVGILINADVNVQNELMMGLFGILVRVNVSVINYVGKYFDYINCKCRKRMVGKKILMEVKWFETKWKSMQILYT